MVKEVFLVSISGMVVRKNRKVKNCWGIEEESVSGDYKDDLEMWKVAEIEEQIFGWDCRGCCMLK